MGMSTHVVGFKPPDEKWKKMKSAWDACRAANVVPPGEVMDFFNHEPPDDSGVEVSPTALKKTGAVTEWSNDHASGYEVDVKKLPADVTVIRFYNSW